MTIPFVAGAVTRGAVTSGAEAATASAAAQASTVAQTVGQGLQVANAPSSVVRDILAPAKAIMMPFEAGVGYGVELAGFRVLLASENLQYAEQLHADAASLQDARRTIGSAVQDGNSGLFDILSGRVGWGVKVMRALSDVRSSAISMWERYGYMTNRTITPGRLDVMSNFSYWETRDATIIGSGPAADRDVIASAFNAGVTVWNNLNLVGTNPSNTPTGV